MALSNNLTAVLNFIAFLCSVPIVASEIWLASQPDNECINFVRWPVVLLVLVVSLTGFVGAYWYKETLLAFYLCCMAILIALLLTLLVFAFVDTRPDGGYAIPGRGYREYRIEGFSSWLQGHIIDSKNWGAIRACLAESDVCSRLTRMARGPGDFAWPTVARTTARVGFSACGAAREGGRGGWSWRSREGDFC
ncbi:unnamed protein product [Linum tenue]|uniref:Tetraspanin-2 n=1 Tax=Linum tenue TaxID=586396 RepID=A0AAV0S7M1_9ROSI|nr:unnamed protein product [Linum tenue]